MSDPIAAMAREADMAERALLGACLISERAYTDASNLLTADDFHQPVHADLWNGMGGAWTGGERLDVVTVGRHCPHVPAELLAGLLADTPSVSNAMRYASQVVDLAARRRLIHAASEMIQAAQQTDAEEALGRARDALAGISLAAGKPTPDPDVDSFIGSVDTTHDWLVPGWLERGDRLLVTASEGAGKSTFLAQIATQVSAGIHPWSFGRMKPRNVTYIDLENGDRLVSRRLQDQRHYVPEDYDPQRFRVQVKPEGLNLLKRADRRWLMQRCLANQAELLVIGPAYRMMSGSASKNDAGGEDQTREVTAALDEVRTQCGLVLLIETHAPHGNSVTGRDLRPFGSTVWLRWPEFGIGLRQESPQDHNTFAIDMWRNPRDQRDWPTHLVKRRSVWPWTPIMPGSYRGHQAA
jgi:hypothetical protein